MARSGSNMARSGSNILADNKETMLQIEACLLDNFNRFCCMIENEKAQFIWKNLTSFYDEFRIPWVGGKIY